MGGAGSQQRPSQGPATIRRRRRADHGAGSAIVVLSTSKGFARVAMKIGLTITGICTKTIMWRDGSEAIITIGEALSVLGPPTVLLLVVFVIVSADEVDDYDDEP